MHTYRVILLLLLFAVMFSVVYAQKSADWVVTVHDYNYANNDTTQQINLQPKYGSAPKNDALKASDAKFFAAMDDLYKHNRKKAARDISLLGWQSLREGNKPDAMRRFNQAWLLDTSNGSALWGMGAIEAGIGEFDESLKLFAEAEGSQGSDINFSIDYAKAMGFAGAQTKNEARLKDAFARFARLYDKAPQNTLNLENWAKTLFLVGDYAEAWAKVNLAEKTRGEVDPIFLKDLKDKMPRP